MSLKQRAVRCSGYIPASQYVPVYSRPHRTDHAQWHEEIAPVKPKPTFDDPYNSRSQSIHDAVKQWLESSPNSVIGPLYRSRSPSSGSPPSNGGESVEHKTPNQAGTPLREANNDRFYDIGSGGLSPRQVSIEQSIALHSGSSASSPMSPDRSDSTPWEHTNTTRTLLSPVKEGGVKSVEQAVLPKEEDEGKSTGTNDVVPPSIPQEPCVANRDLLQGGGQSALTEEGTTIPSMPRRGGKKRSITELRSPDRQHSYGSSADSFSDLNSRGASREFDNELALAVREIEKQSPSDTWSCASGSSSSPTVLLKPPRGLEKNVPYDAEQNLALALPRAGSARDAQNSAVMRLLPPPPRAPSDREDHNAAGMRLPRFHWAGGAKEDTTRVAGHVNQTAEIVSVAAVSEIVENGFGDEENVSKGGQKHQPTDAIQENKVGSGANATKIVEYPLKVGSKTESSDAPRLTLKAAMQSEENLATRKLQTRLSDSPLMSNGVAAVAYGVESRQERPSGRARSAYSSGASVANSAKSVTQQQIYKVSPVHQMAKQANRLKKLDAVAPAEAEQERRSVTCTNPAKSTEKEASPVKLALDKAKQEELQVKADAWEDAKNATILNRYKSEEDKIHAWEERQVAKATVALSKVESELERTRAKATDKMRYEVEQAQKKAAAMKEHAEAKRAERVAKAAMQAQVLRVVGKSPLSCFCP